MVPLSPVWSCLSADRLPAMELCFSFFMCSPLSTFPLCLSVLYPWARRGPWSVGWESCLPPSHSQPIKLSYWDNRAPLRVPVCAFFAPWTDSTWPATGEPAGSLPSLQTVFSEVLSTDSNGKNSTLMYTKCDQNLMYNITLKAVSSFLVSHPLSLIFVLISF